MRIIAGTYKGRHLKSVRDRRLRPATDRVKGSIFNILQNRIDLRGAEVLDLFAGSGSLGLEALSRGAARVVFVDEWPVATKVIEENMKLLGCEDRCEVIRSDAYRFLRNAGGQYDLVFVDPPYRLENAAELPRRIFERNLVSPTGLLVMEHTVNLRFEPRKGFQISLPRTFGSTVVSFFSASAAEASVPSITS